MGFQGVLASPTYGRLRGSVGKWLGSCATRWRSRIRVRPGNGTGARDFAGLLRRIDPEHGQIGVAETPDTATGVPCMGWLEQVGIPYMGWAQAVIAGTGTP